MDHENRLAEASTRRQKVRYKYDALGRRVQRFLVGNKENTKYTYDGLDVVMDDDSGTTTKYQNGPGIDNKLSLKTGSDVKYFLTDHLGSTNALTDSSGAITSQASYDSFGNQTGNLATRYSFTGRENDSFTGLMHYRARQYDSKSGRFISEDPIGFGGGDINLYGYVWNNPQHFIDPMGLNGWGTNFANWADSNISYARNYWQRDQQNWWHNGWVNTWADVAYGFSDMFRVGGGLGCAIYAPDIPDYRRLELGAADVVRGGGLFLTMAGPFAGKFGGPSATASDVPASAPVGRRGSPMSVGDKNLPPTNAPGEVSGRPYSGHAFDRMQGRGIPPSVVENTIRHGVPSPGRYPGTTVYTESVNNVTVVVNSSTGRVITVF